jgi:DNA polymerase/3'-5' exonuclease PolX
MDQLLDEQIEKSRPYVAEIKKFAHLSLIGTHEFMKLENLAQLGDFSYLLDLHKPVPANIQDVILRAHGCGV